ncbi:hypothetical protein [uncultured Tateyamaria sp.]|uniref:hypothetical protein n=1 Tax=Tateyamaria sp. TaxID=1929288 RepID=UPI00262F4DC5|nr:hypothetical protein [uncultured Tateyamaria sp.]
MPEPDLSMPCCACKQSIPKGAAKCFLCGSAQGMRRWVTTIATGASVAIAAVTLVGLVGPQVQFYLSPETAVHVSTIAATGDHYVVLVENRGRRAVVLNRAIAFWPEHPDLSGAGMAWLDIHVVGGQDITLIEGRTSQVIAMYYPTYDGAAIRPDTQNGIFAFADYPPQGSYDCKVEFDFVNAEGSFYKYASAVEVDEDGVPYQCAPEYWNFLRGVKAVG